VLYIIYTRSKYIFDVLHYILYIQFVQGGISTKISICANYLHFNV